MANINSKKKELVKVALSGVTMLDAGKKMNKGLDMPSPSVLKSSDVRYPTLYIDKDQAPALDGYEVGDTCTLVVKAKVIGHNVTNSENYKSDEYRVEILKIGKAN